MRIPPVNTFNPNRVLYKLKSADIYAKKGFGEVIESVTKKTVLLTNMKDIGIATNPNTETRFMILDSTIRCMYENGKNSIYTRNCSFIHKAGTKPKWKPIAQVVYTNKP